MTNDISVHFNDGRIQWKLGRFPLFVILSCSLFIVTYNYSLCCMASIIKYYLNIKKELPESRPHKNQYLSPKTNGGLFVRFKMKLVNPREKQQAPEIGRHNSRFALGFAKKLKCSFLEKSKISIEANDEANQQGTSVTTSVSRTVDSFDGCLWLQNQLNYC